MRREASISLLTFSLLSLISTGYSGATIDNANHIFNAVHSSMRQWGSSLNHNGMSFFLATVPEGTQLYHGTSDPDFVKGMQWLAFEPEHALIFAHPRRPPPGEGEKPHSDRKGAGKSAVPHNGAGWGQKESLPEHNYVKEMASNHRQHHDKPQPLPPLRNGHDTPPPPYEQGPRRHREFPPPPPLPPGHVYKPYPPPPRKPRPNRGPKHPWDPTHHRPPPPGLPSESLELRSTSSGLREPQSQEPLRVNPPPSSPPSERTGYLHTYVTRHALRLLYIDGLSAGKTENGTLDTQDRLLLNLTDEQMGRPFGGEMLRARGLCELAAGLWEGRVDGILRMEGGFEVILCEFEQHLERVDVVHVEEGGIGRPGRGVMGGWQYIKAITSRYHGLGGDRVHIDYDRFVSVFAHHAPGLWDNDVHSDTRMPRLTSVPPTTLSTIKNEVTHMILNAHRASPPSHARNWQTITDTVVARYSTPLHHITTSPLLRSDPDALAAYLSTLLRPFIDARARNAPLETARCIAQLLPPLTSTTSNDPPLAHRALHTVTSRICDTLLTALSISSAPTPHVSYRAVYAARAVDGVQELVDWLAWTSWKECATCADEEVCFVPIWPMGASEDHARPRCRGEEGVAQQRGYWGRMGPPRGRDGEKEGEGERV